MTIAVETGGGVGMASSAPRDRAVFARLMMLMLLVGLALTSVASLAWGASGASLFDALGALIMGDEISLRDRVVLLEIRLPRLVLGILVGASLAVSGALMQGLFRNPLADPGLVGVNAGAGLGAITGIIFAGALPAAMTGFLGYYLVPLMAFFGGWVTTLILYTVATRRGQTSVATMLLAGIALGALFGAAGAIMTYYADDNQLRDLTFWGMGSLGGATWSKVLTAAPIIVLALSVAPLLGKGLNGLALGEAAAGHLGIDVQRIKRIAILSVAAATGAAVAVSGGIGFVGIVVPHLLRLSIGPDHRWLLPNAAILGAILLLIADMISRVVIAPAELPIGIVMAVIGGPVFLWILLRRRGVLDM